MACTQQTQADKDNESKKSNKNLFRKQSTSLELEYAGKLKIKIHALTFL